MAMLLVTFASVAHALTLGEPIQDPEVGILGLKFRTEVNRWTVVDPACAEDRGCEAAVRTAGMMGEIDFSPISGVGLFGSFGKTHEKVPEIEFRGNGDVYGGGIRLGRRFGRSWRLGANGQLEWLSSKGDATQPTGHQRITGQFAELSGLVGLGDAEQGASVWLGVGSIVSWDLSLEPFGPEGSDYYTKIPVDPKLPATVSLGTAFTSDPVGSGWRRSLRFTLGGEARVGQTWGASVWLGTMY